MNGRISTWVGALSLLLLPFGAVAAADGLGVFLTNPELQGPPGSVLVVEGTLHNFTDDILYINGVSSTLDRTYDLQAQYEYFQQVMPRTLFPGEVWEGPLLKVVISPEAAINRRSFALGFLGGPHGLSQDLLEVGYFVVDDSTTVVAVPDLDGPGHASLSASPNPFSSRMELSISLPARQQIDVAVYDVAGHQVRRLYSGTADAGLQRYPWDGVNDQGRKVTSGIYYVRVRSDDRLLKTKVVLCR